MLLRDPRRQIKNRTNGSRRVSTYTTEQRCMNRKTCRYQPPSGVPVVDTMFNAPDKDETLNAVMALRNWSSPDIVGVQSEVLKAAVQSRVVLDLLFSIILYISPFPKHWLESIGCTIWKGKTPKDDLRSRQLEDGEYYCNHVKSDG